MSLNIDYHVRVLISVKIMWKRFSILMQMHGFEREFARTKERLRFI